MSDPTPGRAVRRAADKDAPALAALASTSPAEIHRLMTEGEFLVLDHPEGGLAAAVHISMEGSRGRVGLLSIRPGLDVTALAPRLLAVACLLCEAHGCQLIQPSLPCP